MSQNKKKIVIAGPFPPPYGGVSIHIKRLCELLGNDYHIEVIDESRHRKDEIFNIRNGNIFGYFKRIVDADVVHIHSGLLSLRLFHFLATALLFKKRIITIHGYEPGRSLMERTLDKFMSGRSWKTIFVSKEIAERFGVRDYSIVNAFLPPGIYEENDLPDKLTTWLRDKKDRGYSICAANAWRLDVHNNQDMYGLDLCIQAVKELKDDAVNAAMVYIVCEDTGKIKLDTYRKLIDDYQLDDRFLLYESPVSFIRLIRESDMIIRPTNTDGDALTVREGLYYGKIVIASDVVQRPGGVFLFENRNASSLAKVIANRLNGNAVESGSAIDQGDLRAEYLELYKKEVYGI